MAKQPKKKPPTRKVPDWEARKVLAANVERRMRQKFSESTNRPQALADAAKVSLSRVQELLSQSSGASVDTISKVAAGLGCRMSDLVEDGPVAALEIVTIWRDTDDFGQTNILQTAKAWKEARPRKPNGGSAEGG